VCPVNNVELVTQRLGTRDVTRVILPDSGHVVTEDFERQRAADVFDEFITRFR
jgi:esterase/lipase